jgi:hypothetical protein
MALDHDGYYGATSAAALQDTFFQVAVMYSRVCNAVTTLAAVTFLVPQTWAEAASSGIAWAPGGTPCTSAGTGTNR